MRQQYCIACWSHLTQLIDRWQSNCKRLLLHLFYSLSLDIDEYSTLCELLSVPVTLWHGRRLKGLAGPNGTQQACHWQEIFREQVLSAGHGTHGHLHGLAEPVWRPCIAQLNNREKAVDRSTPPPPGIWKTGDRRGPLDPDRAKPRWCLDQGEANAYHEPVVGRHPEVNAECVGRTRGVTLMDTKEACHSGAKWAWGRLIHKNEMRLERWLTRLRMRIERFLFFLLCFCVNLHVLLEIFPFAIFFFSPAASFFCCFFLKFSQCRFLAALTTTRCNAWSFLIWGPCVWVDRMGLSRCPLPKKEKNKKKLNPYFMTYPGYNDNYNTPVGSACRVFSSSLSFLKLVNLTNSAPHRWLSKCCFCNKKSHKRRLAGLKRDLIVYP